MVGASTARPRRGDRVGHWGWPRCDQLKLRYQAKRMWPLIPWSGTDSRRAFPVHIGCAGRWSQGGRKSAGIRYHTTPRGRGPRRAATPDIGGAGALARPAAALAGRSTRAGEVRVAVREQGCLLVVEVADDGVGGADASGSGLRGLADRVAAAAGTFEINSPAGVGTRLRACLRSGAARVTPGPQLGQAGDGTARPGEL